MTTFTILAALALVGLIVRHFLRTDRPNGRHRALLVLGAAGAVLWAGCGGDPELNQARLREFISTELAGQLGYPLTDISCPRVVNPKPGDEFECQATIEGQRLRLSGVVTGDDGEVSMQNADAVLVLTRVEDFVADDLGAQIEEEVTVDCGGGEVLVQAPGSTFACVASTASDSAEVVVEVLDAEGLVTYEVG